jgi:hypothetical protein
MNHLTKWNNNNNRCTEDGLKQFIVFICEIKMELRETGWDDMDWIDLAQDRDQWRPLVNTVLNLRVP